jgi:hypothetical protein
MECIRADLTPASGRQNHTTSPSAFAPFVKSASASTASHPAFVTIAKRPSCRAGREHPTPDFYFWKSEIFFASRLDKRACRETRMA